MVARTRSSGPAPKASGPTKPRAARPKPKLAARAAGKPDVRIFLSYSHKDAAARGKLESHLAPLTRDRVDIFTDDRIDAGGELDRAIAKELKRAHIFVALISPDYLASRYCWDVEYAYARRRRLAGTMRVIGVVVRPSVWKQTELVRFKQLPRDGKAVPDWQTADHAYRDVAEGITAVVKTLRREMAATAKKPARAKPKGVRTIGRVKATPGKATRPGKRKPKR